MKKLILILSYTFGSIALLVLIGILLYYTVWLQSFNNMKADDDYNTYVTIYTNYSNGTLTVKNPQNNTIEIITPDDKKVVNFPDSPVINTPELFDNHFVIIEDNTISLFDTDFKLTDEIKTDGEIIARMYGKDHMLYYATNNKIYGYNVQQKDSDVVFSSDYGEIYNITMINELFYIGYMKEEYAYNLVEYNPKESVISAEYSLNNLDFSEKFTIVGVFTDNVYIRTYNHEYLSEKIYEYNLLQQDIELIGEFSGDTKIKDEFIYFVGQSVDFETSENNPEEYGLWRLNLKTKITEFVSDKVDEHSYYLCTDNFVYSYKFSYIFEDDSGSSPFHRIYRGYTVDQIPIDKG